MKEVIVIGGGLAGVEAAWQVARAGTNVRLYEMRPVRQTPAHRSDKLAEIVCSNSLKSDEPGTASYLLKEELRRGRSLVMDVAAATRVPAGAALAVDRHAFADDRSHINDRRAVAGFIFFVQKLNFVRKKFGKTFAGGKLLEKKKIFTQRGVDRQQSIVLRHRHSLISCLRSCLEKTNLPVW